MYPSTCLLSGVSLTPSARELQGLKCDQVDKMLAFLCTCPFSDSKKIKKIQFYGLFIFFLCTCPTLTSALRGNYSSLTIVIPRQCMAKKLVNYEFHNILWPFCSISCLSTKYWQQTEKFPKKSAVVQNCAVFRTLTF